MRGRMSDAPSYAPPVAVGEAMLGETVARVDQSLNPNFRVGELVLSANGWQELAISNGNGLVKLPAALARPSYALGVHGNAGLHRLCGTARYRKASGRGDGGGRSRHRRRRIGRRADREDQGLPGRRQWRAAPRNAPGRSSSWASMHASITARRHSTPSSRPRVPQASTSTTRTSAARYFAPCCACSTRMRAFRCAGSSRNTTSRRKQRNARRCRRSCAPSWSSASPCAASSYPTDSRIAGRSFSRRWAGWLREGKVKYREDVVEGLENAPSAFLGLLAGRNFGKLVVRVDRGAKVA